MNAITTCRIEQDILSMPVTKPYNMLHHGPHNYYVSICQPGTEAKHAAGSEKVVKTIYGKVVEINIGKIFVLSISSSDILP
jgi:hypothetical protein